MIKNNKNHFFGACVHSNNCRKTHLCTCGTPKYLPTTRPMCTHFVMCLPKPISRERSMITYPRRPSLAAIRMARTKVELNLRLYEKFSEFEDPEALKNIPPYIGGRDFTNL